MYGKINTAMDFRPRNEQLMHENAPPTIRDLAEQNFAMRQRDTRENSVRKQRDDTLYRRSMDPGLTHNRKDAPDATSMPKFTKEGIIQRQPAAQGAAQPAPAQQQPAPAQPAKDSTTLNRLVGPNQWSNIVVMMLLAAAVVGVAVLFTCNWKK